MASLEEKLAKLRLEEKKILEKIDKRNRKRTIKCKGCNHYHKIEELVAIQTYWYERPRGCTEGDLWIEGELQFICPETGITNRLLFDNYDVPYEEREKYRNNPEKQFKAMYRKLFKEIKEKYIRGYVETEYTTTVINRYVDHNRKKFGLVEKKKN